MHLTPLHFIVLTFGLCFTMATQATENKPFFDDFQGSEIDQSKWLVATWREHNAQTGRERCFVKDGYLHLIFRNDSKDGWLNSAIQTRDEFLYGTWEARLKATSVPGVLNSMYTIDWDDRSKPETTGDGTKQEIDIEFLTRFFKPGRGEVHLAVHAADKKSWDTRPRIPLKFNPSEDFHVWGFEVTPEHIRWFVDGKTLHIYEYAKNDITINAPYMLKFNTWTSERWIEGPPEPDVDCVYLIDWVRFTPMDTSEATKP